MEYEGNTMEEVSQTLEMPESTKSRTTTWEKNFSKRWKQPTKSQMVESIDVSKHAIASLSDRIGQLEITTTKLISYINQKIP